MRSRASSQYGRRQFLKKRPYDGKGSYGKLMSMISRGRGAPASFLRPEKASVYREGEGLREVHFCLSVRGSNDHECKKPVARRGRERDFLQKRGAGKIWRRSKLEKNLYRQRTEAKKVKGLGEVKRRM